MQAVIFGMRVSRSKLESVFPGTPGVASRVKNDRPNRFVMIMAAPPESDNEPLLHVTGEVIKSL